MTILDFALVEKYGPIMEKGQSHVILEMKLSQLFNNDDIERFVNVYGEKLQALKKEVAATYFCSSFGYICAMYQNILSTYNAKLPVTLNDVAVQLYHNQDNNYYALSYKWLTTKRAIREEDSSEEWRQEQLASFYQETVTPLLQMFAKATGIRIRELWGQLLLGLHYGHQTGSDLTTSPKQKEQVLKDYHWLLDEAAPSTFSSEKHPLQFPYHEMESLKEPGKMLRMKPTCCLYYQTKTAANKCYTCPRLSEAEREQRISEILLASQV